MAPAGRHLPTQIEPASLLGKLLLGKSTSRRSAAQAMVAKFRHRSGTFPSSIIIIHDCKLPFEPVAVNIAASLRHDVGNMNAVRSTKPLLLLLLPKTLLGLR